MVNGRQAFFIEVFSKDNLIEEIVFNEAVAKRISERVIALFRDQIKSGAVMPELKAATIALKRKLGRAFPEAPLYATGNLAESLFMASWNPLLISIDSNATVEPSWHFSEDDRYRARGVPFRDPFAGLDDQIDAIIAEEMDRRQ
jgi:hypothetical protein